MRQIGFTSIVLVVLLLTACARQNDVDKMGNRQDALEARIVALETAKPVDSGKLISEKDLDWVLQMKINSKEVDGSASIGVGDTGYRVAVTEHGGVAVAFREIKAVGSGSAVTLSFVNLSGVAWTGVEFSGGYSNFSAGDALTKVASAEFSHKVSGTWSPAVEALETINFPKMGEKDLKTIWFTISPSGIKYRK